MYIHTHSDQVDLLNSDIFAFFFVQFVFEHLQFHFNMFMFLGDIVSRIFYKLSAFSSILCFVFKVFFFLMSSSYIGTCLSP